MKDLKELVVVSGIGGHRCWEIVDIKLEKERKKNREKKERKCSTQLFSSIGLCPSFRVMSSKKQRLWYLQAGGDQGLVFNLSEHVSQKVLVHLCLLLFQHDLLELKGKVVGVASLDVALEHVVCDESHDGYICMWGRREVD